MSIAAMKQALEYTRPGAIVPVTPETVKMLVDALRLAIEQAERPYADKAALLNSDRLRIDPVTGNVGIGSVTQAERQEPVACDGDFPEGFDKSFSIPAQALRQANAALCEVTNNRMWDVPALAERMMRFCLYTAPPQRQRQPLTDAEIWRQYQSLWPFHPQEEPRLAADMATFARAIERAHGIGGEG